jgi:hypothetical protein
MGGSILHLPHNVLKPSGAAKESKTQSQRLPDLLAMAHRA